MVFKTQAFVSLYVLQALAFVSGFCGIIIHQVQRISDAHECRVLALADKSLLKALAPTIATVLGETSAMNKKEPMLLTVSNELFIKYVQINLVKEVDDMVVFKITTMRANGHAGCWAYLFMEKSHATYQCVYRGMQLGTAI